MPSRVNLLCYFLLVVAMATLLLLLYFGWSAEQMHGSHNTAFRATDSRRTSSTGNHSSAHGLLVDMCKNDKENEIPDSLHMNSTGYRVPDYPLVNGDKFTIIILTHDRDKILRQVLAWYGKMAKVDRIIVYWNNPERTPPNFSQELRLNVSLIIEAVNITNLGERFRPNPNIRTNGEYLY